MKLLNQFFVTQMLMSGSSKTQRHFIKLDSVLNSYGVLNTPFVATGDFDVTYLLVSSDTSADMALEDSSGFTVKVGYCLIYIDNPDGLELLVGTGDDFNRYIFGGQSLLLNGALNSVVLSRRSGTLSATLNGATLGGTFTNTSTLVFEGNVGGGEGREFNGIIANPTFTDLSNPANNQTYKLDQATGNVETSQEGNHTLTYVNIPESNRELFTLTDEGWLGEELWTYGQSVTTGAEIGFEYISQLLTVDTEKAYSYEVTVTGMTTGQIYLWGISEVITADGVYVGVAIPTTTQVGVRVGSEVPNADVSVSVSIKRLIEVA